jgi:hypothetical protein
MHAIRRAVCIINAIYYTACGMAFIAGKKNTLSFGYTANMYFAKA